MIWLTPCRNGRLRVTDQLWWGNAICFRCCDCFMKWPQIPPARHLLPNSSPLIRIVFFCLFLDIKLMPENLPHFPSSALTYSTSTLNKKRVRQTQYVLFCKVTYFPIERKEKVQLYAAKFNFMPLDFDAAYCYPVWFNML